MEQLMESKVPVYHNALFDMRMLSAAGVDIDVQKPFHDTMAMVHVLFSAERVGLKDLGEMWLDIPKDDEKALGDEVKRLRKGAEAKGWKIATKGRWGDQPWKADYWLAGPELEVYNRKDSERTMLLLQILLDELEKFPALVKKYTQELDVIRATYRMIGKGVACRKDICTFEIKRNNLARKQHYGRVLKMHQQIHPGAAPLNVNSPKQLIQLIYTDLKNPVLAFTEKDNPATDADALAAIDHPIVKEIVKTKSAEKAVNNFFGRYRMLTGEDGILHPEFKPFGARTSRYSCSAPNLQNVANALNTRSSEPIQARTPFVPRPGKVWYHWDWSQMEMWIFAAEAKEELMLHDLRTGNLHNSTANRMYGQGRDIVKEELEQGGRSNSKAKAKMFNFGVVFGMGVPSAADFLKCGKAEARRELGRYYTAYPRIRPYMDEISSEAAREGFIWTRPGHRLQVDSGFAYKACNYKVQGGAAGHMRNKLVWLDKFCRSNFSAFGMELILTVHDELVVEAEENERTLDAVRFIKEELEDHDGLWPEIKNLPVETAITRTNWALKEKLDLL